MPPLSASLTAGDLIPGFAATFASSPSGQVAEVLRTVHHLKGTVDSLKSQLESERAMRANLEAKVSVMMAAMPGPSSSRSSSSSSSQNRL